MKRKMGILVLFVLVAGCSSMLSYYEPATVQDGTISNAKVGWNGYSINVPDGMTVFNPTTADPHSAKLSDFKRWFIEEERRYAAAGYINYTEHFLLENEDGGFSISFIADTYSLSAGWGSVTSMESTYLLRQIANNKMVAINDNSAERTELTINGQPAWQISGVSKPYFKKEYVPLAYEGYFVMGRLKEAFWVEGYGDLESRDELKKKVKNMVESLRIH